MDLKGYFLSIALGIIGFCAGIIILPWLSIQSVASVDSKIYVVDSKPNSKLGVHNIITINKDPLNFKNSTIKSSTVDVDDINLITYKQLSFSVNPSFLLWIIVISIAIAIAFALIPMLLYLLKSVSNNMSRKTVYIYSIVALFSFGITFAFAQFFGFGKILTITELIKYSNILFSRTQIVMICIPIILLIPCVLSLIGNYMIVSQIVKINSQTEIKTLIALHKKFSTFLVVSSVMLVFGVLSPSLLRMSILEIIPANLFYLFPKQFVISFSLIYTFFLILFYMPVELLFRNKFVDIKFKLDENEKEELDEILSKMSVFKIGLTIFAPIISTVFMESLKAFI